MNGSVMEAKSLAADDKYRFEKPRRDTAVCAAAALSEAIRFETVTGNLDEIKKLKEFLIEKYPALHRVSEYQNVGSESILLVWRSKKKAQDKLPVMFCAHLDVVPAGEGWKHPPFSGHIDEEYVWGRGAIDCKNVLIALLEAAESLCERGFYPERDIYFAFGHDEEIGGIEGASSIAEFLKKRNIKFDMALDEGEYIQTAFTKNKKVPTALISVAEKGFLNLRIKAYSKGGHSSMPPKHSAVGVICEAVCRIEMARIKCRMIPLIKKCFQKTIPSMPFARRILFKTLPVMKWAFFMNIKKDQKLNAYISDTYAVTMAKGANVPNVLPEEAQAVMNIRILQGSSCEDVVNHVKKATYGLGLSYEVLAAYEPSRVSGFEDEMFLLLEDVLKERFGDIVVAPGLMTGGTDVRKYESFCKSVYRFMPFYLTEPIAKRMHATNECVSIDSLGAAVEFYKVLFERL